MKKIQITGLVLVAVFAFSAVVTAAALAGEWLVEGAALAVALPAETEGLVELHAYTNGTGTTLLNTIDCEGIFDGTIGPGGATVIEDALTLAETVVGELTGTGVNCTVTFSKGELGDCNQGTLAEVWPDNLNLATGLVWTLTFELMANGENLLIFPATVGYDVECETGLGKLANLCEGSQSVALVNEPGLTPGSVLGTFAALAAAERANCTLTGNNTGEVLGMGDTWATGGTDLTTRLLTAVS